MLQKHTSSDFTTITVRPSTVCGYAPRLRLDVIVNILTAHAMTNRKIKVFGGAQYRPNIHIDDMVDFYMQSLVWEDAKINGEIYNVGYLNYTVNDIADMVVGVIGEDVTKEIVPTDDNRSYRVCCDKIYEQLGFKCERSIIRAIEDLKHAFEEKKIENAMDNSFYYNIKRMQQVELV